MTDARPSTVGGSGAQPTRSTNAGIRTRMTLIAQSLSPDRPPSGYINLAEPNPGTSRRTRERTYGLSPVRPIAGFDIAPADMEFLHIGAHVRLGTRHRYDRKVLDAHLDRLAGLDSSAELNVNKADAELARFIADHPDAARGP
ncbi:hypothetical protein [Brevundimonas albigilva]|uniref:Uncharacterized protein n=1 Tax=Brevundimonas albigilva TaxID=1312364 RepID=A0ABY4SS07_9CAUL|nr:hypothetical protein [Brevundimonas albigilva]URI16656.1 hypothetical protein M8231_06710 [Brevundimonas albigilva]